MFSIFVVDYICSHNGVFAQMCKVILSTNIDANKNVRHMLSFFTKKRILGQYLSLFATTIG